MPSPAPKYAKHPSLTMLGEAIRRAREANGISQEELAERAGIDRSYMSSIERGVQSTGVLLLVRVAEALQTSLSVIFADANL